VRASASGRERQPKQRPGDAKRQAVAPPPDGGSLPCLDFRVPFDGEVGRDSATLARTPLPSHAGPTGCTLSSDDQTGRYAGHTTPHHRSANCPAVVSGRLDAVPRRRARPFRTVAPFVPIRRRAPKRTSPLLRKSHRPFPRADPHVPSEGERPSTVHKSHKLNDRAWIAASARLTSCA